MKDSAFKKLYSFSAMIDNPSNTRLSSTESPPADAAQTKLERIRFRVAPLILLTQAICIWWVVDSEIARDVYLICYSLMMPTVLYLLLALLLRRWLPFNNRELLLGYIVLTATIPIVGFGGLRFVVEGMGYMQFLSEAQPQWVKFLPSLVRLPVLHDPQAIRDFYAGGASVPWKAWIGPIIFWSTYLGGLSLLWICLAGILRRIWIHQERLTFPIAMIPLQLNEHNGAIFRNPLLWYGFAIPAVLQSLLAINFWVPSVPCIQMKAFNLQPVAFTTPPWNALPGLMVGFYPMAIGLAYFIPSDISFSCWFFSILTRLSYVAGAAVGIDAAGTGAARFPYRDEQAAGAWIAFAGLVIWGARHHWRTVKVLVSADERQSLRKLSVMAVLCVVLCAAMMSVVGIPPILSLGVVIVYASFVLSGARVRAESGGQWTFASAFWTPTRVGNSVFGTQGVGNQALVANGHFDLIHSDIRGQSLPYLMESLDIAEKVGIRWRTVLLWVAAGTATALIMGWWCTLTKLYDIGAATAKANDYPFIRIQRSFNEIERLSLIPGKPDVPGVAAMVFAMGFTLALALWRRLGLFGLHPVGYVLCNTFTMSSFIVPFFIAWAAKVSILRFFGHKTYRGSIPFFVGVALGDIVTQALWALIGAVLDVPVYQFLS